MRQVPKFRSVDAEREFWDTHDAIEILGERAWKVSEPCTTRVSSVYMAKVGPRGAVIRVPKEWLATIGAREGRRIKARVSGKRLVMELA